MELCFLRFVGPKKESAEVSFGPGLNLIYGPSNTGKSSILDAIDFMFGRERALKELPEHEGYDQIILGVVFSNGEEFTFIRSIRGGDYKCYQGLHKQEPKELPPILLTNRKSKKKGNFSQFVLERIGLNDKKLIRNIKNEKVSLTLRTLFPLSIISETEIQKEGSPFIGEQYIEKTEHSSRLKLLLTGVDDSSILQPDSEKRKASYYARIEFINELIEEHRKILTESVSEEDSFEDLQSQEEKLSETIEKEQLLLQSTDEQYNQFLTERSVCRKELEQNEERHAEISEMLGRFALLKDQYDSDIKRLENISEAGSLVAALPSEKCLWCGSKISENTEHEYCDVNLKDIVVAAESEKAKISVLYRELIDAMHQLGLEKRKIEDDLPEISNKIHFINEKLLELNPEVSSKRRNYTDLLTIKLNVERSLELFAHLEKLQNKKQELEKEIPEEGSSEVTVTSIPTKALNDVAQYVKKLLNEWDFPNTDNVYFDKQIGDFVINGKHRVSNGKGYRAITHAAATLALMKFCEERNLEHPGFVLLDSPLLAYEEPDSKDDDLTGTDVNKKFFDYLSKWHSRQIIVFENKKSIPDHYSSGEQIIHFTKSEIGRYGFFPT